MKIINHWLEGVERQLLPGGDEMPTRRLLVIHATAGASGQSSRNFWDEPEAKGASAHLIIERNGKIIQVRPFNKTCGHAGKSRWRDPKTGVRYGGANAYSIGIELANAQDVMLGEKTRKELDIVYKDGWEVYYPAQLEACKQVSKLLVDTYHLDDLAGHSDIAPERKSDPNYLHFPMLELRRFCGFEGMPKIHKI